MRAADRHVDAKVPDLYRPSFKLNITKTTGPVQKGSDARQGGEVSAEAYSKYAAQASGRPTKQMTLFQQAPQKEVL